MAVAATPVDAEKAGPNRAGQLLGSITPITDGSDYESPDILSDRLDSPTSENYNPQENLDPQQEGPATRNGTAERLRTIRWVDGYRFFPDDCDGGHIVDPCVIGSGETIDGNQAQAVGVPTTAQQTPTWTDVEPIHPFVIEITEQFSVFGAVPATWHLERAKRKLAAVRGKVLAKEWWRGDQAKTSGWTNNQYLTSTDLHQISGVWGYKNALGRLEQAIADNSAWQRGVIHCTPLVASLWISEHLVRAIPNPPATLLTELGTIVIADSGYDGSGPGDSTAGLGNLSHVQWAYATGIPQIRFGQVTQLDTDDDAVAMDRSGNTRTLRYGQFASICFTPCIHHGLIVNCTTALSTPGS